MIGNLIYAFAAWLAASLVAAPFAGGFLSKGLGRDEPPWWWEEWMTEGEALEFGEETLR